MFRNRIRCTNWEQIFEEHAAGLLLTGDWEDWNRSFRPELNYVAVVWPEISVYFTTDFRRHVQEKLVRHIAR